MAFAGLGPRAQRVVATEFLRRGVNRLPYNVHTVFTDNGVQFNPQAHQFLTDGQGLDRICRECGVERCLTKPAHPWTNGPVERLNRTIKQITVHCHHYQTRTISTSTGKLSCWPTTTPSASRLCVASRRKSLSARSGKSTPLSLPETPPTSRWDYTFRMTFHKLICV